MLFGGPQDSNGFKRSIIGLWRLQYGPFAFFSFQPDMLSSVAPQLHYEAAKEPAQLRVHANDITSSQIAPFMNNWGYARTRETALGNVRLMHSLNQQLHVPVKDCREAAEFLLAAKLVCPLGGQYVVRDVAGGASRWTSTKIEESPLHAGAAIAAPAGYVAPPLNWFRGLDLHATFVDRLLAAHAEVVMQMPEKGVGNLVPPARDAKVEIRIASEDAPKPRFSIDGQRKGAQTILNELATKLRNSEIRSQIEVVCENKREDDDSKIFCAKLERLAKLHDVSIQYVVPRGSYTGVTTIDSRYLDSGYLEAERFVLLDRLKPVSRLS